MLLFILNLFVSRTTHQRPYLHVWGFVHPRQNRYASERVCGLFFYISFTVFKAPLVCILLPARLVASGAALHIQADDVKLRVNNICGNQTEGIVDEACPPAEMFTACCLISMWNYFFCLVLSFVRYKSDQPHPGIHIYATHGYGGAWVGCQSRDDSKKVRQAVRNAWP